MNIFFRELKAHRKSLIIWCIGMMLMTSAGMAKYAGFSTAGQSINDLMKQLPESVQAVLGAGTFDLSTALGFYVALFLYLVIMGTVHSSMLGANIISKEESEKTAEFLFVKPASRKKIITAKLLAAILNIIILNVVTCIISIVMVGYYNKGASINKDIIILMTGMFILQLMFLFIGTALAAISKRPRSAASMATAVLLTTFILSVAIDINKKLDNLKYFTPFKYYDAKILVANSGGFKTVYLILSVIIICAAVSITYIFYNKRDLNI